MAAKATRKEEMEKDSCCELPPVPERELPADLDPNRAALIRYVDKKWANETVIHYHFLREPAHWRGGSTQEQAVRDAFRTWKELGIGLEFEEVHDPEEAEVRIGFEPGGSWSYVGRDVLGIRDPAQRTMNFGWNLTTPYGRDTAMHEIGHTLGFPHEHQNPKAGIVWDEEAVIEHFGGAPNFWPEQKTRWNILRKIPVQQVEGGDWDRDSIMHYRFAAGLIKTPAEYQTRPLIPASGLSASDIAEVRKFYPEVEKKRTVPELRPYQSHRVRIAAGEQIDFAVVPAYSRDYTIQTFGSMDTVMVLFEEIDGVPRFMSADDDSGSSYNAKITARLIRGRKYLMRLRLYYARAAGEGALMMW